MRIIICDDELIQREQLKEYIGEYARNHSLEVELKEYENTENLWWDLESGLYADLLILDIQLPGQSGIELAHKMRDSKMFHQIAFVSGIRDYVFEGYDVNAISYLLKPYEKDQLFKLLDKARQSLKESSTFSLIEIGKEVFKFYHDDVIAIEATGHDTLIYTKQSNNSQGGEKLLKMGFNNVMTQFPFLVKIHRSYAVNMRTCLQVKRDSCLMEDTYTFPIARGNYEMCMQAFISANKGE